MAAQYLNWSGIGFECVEALIRRDLPPGPSLSTMRAIMSLALTTYGRVEQVKYFETALTNIRVQH
jgi:hypothetical protein